MDSGSGRSKGCLGVIVWCRSRINLRNRVYLMRDYQDLDTMKYGYEVSDSPWSLYEVMTQCSGRSVIVSCLEIPNRQIRYGGSIW